MAHQHKATMDEHDSPYFDMEDVKFERKTGRQNNRMLPITSLFDSGSSEIERDDEGEEKQTRNPQSSENFPFTSYEATEPPTLLTLPAEIRLEILKHLLILPSDAPPPSTNAYYHYGQPSLPSQLHPAILRANRQLHAEGLPLLYRCNTFLAHNMLLTLLPRLRRAYGPVLSEQLANLIQRFHICVRLDAEPGYNREKATAQLTGKEEVVLEAWQAMWRGSGPDVLRLFEGVRGVRRAKVLGSIGGFEDYAKWLEHAMMCEVGTKVEPFFWDAGREAVPSWALG